MLLFGPVRRGLELLSGGDSWGGPGRSTALNPGLGGALCVAVEVIDGPFRPAEFRRFGLGIESRALGALGLEWGRFFCGYLPGA